MTEALHRWTETDRPRNGTGGRHEAMKSASRMGFRLIDIVPLDTGLAVFDTVRTDLYDPSDTVEPTLRRVITAYDRGQRPRRSIYELGAPSRRGVGA